MKLHKIHAIIGVIFLIGVIFGALVVVIAQVPSSTLGWAPGIYPGAPSFTVWREGSNYFAKDSNGELKYPSSNATYTIQSCINVGNIVLIKYGVYQLDSSILIAYNYVKLIGESMPTFMATASITMLKITKGMYVEISGIFFDGDNKANVGIEINSAYADSGVTFPLISKCMIYRCGTGIKTDETAGWVRRVFVEYSDIYDCDIGIDIQKGYGNTFRETEIAHCSNIGLNIAVYGRNSFIGGTFDTNDNIAINLVDGHAQFTMSHTLIFHSGTGPALNGTLHYSDYIDSIVGERKSEYIGGITIQSGQSSISWTFPVALIADPRAVIITPQYEVPDYPYWSSCNSTTLIIYMNGTAADAILFHYIIKV